MELKSVMRAMRRHWIVVILAFSIVSALGIALALLPPDQYKASAVVLVQPDPSRGQYQAQVVSLVVPSIIAQAESRTFGDTARKDLPRATRSAKVKVNIVDSNGTGVLTITATSTQRSAVAPWATAYAQELAATPAGGGFVTLALLDTAREPSFPYAPKRKPAAISGILLGMIAAVLTAIAAAAFRRRGDELDEVRLRFGTTILGEIPVMRDRRRQGLDMILGSTATPEITEALQSLRTNVELLMQDRYPRTIAVVSASSGEGKSTISAALAWALASVGERVTAVDADLRRPMLHQNLHGRLALGVASADEVPIDRLLQRTSLPTLRLLSAGVPKRHPAEVLRANLPGVLDALQDDTVVIDCPPLDGFAETGSITTMASSVILVIDRRRRDFLDVERSLASLHDRGADILGIVINRSARRSAAGKYYYAAAAGHDDGRRRRPRRPRSNATREVLESPEGDDRLRASGRAAVAAVHHRPPQEPSTTDAGTLSKPPA